MTQPERASVTLSAIVNSIAPPDMPQSWFGTAKIDYSKAFGSTNSVDFDEVKRQMDDVQKKAQLQYLEYMRRLYERPYQIVYQGDKLINLNELGKIELYGRPASLSSGVAISSRIEIVNDLLRAGVIGFGKGDYEFSAGDTNTNALPDGPDLNDDYSDFLDNDDCEDDDE